MPRIKTGMVNDLKIRAIHFAMYSFRSNVTNAHLTKVSTAIHLVNKMSSCKSFSHHLEVKGIWHLAIMSKNFVNAARIPGIMNTETRVVHISSDKKKRVTAWKVRKNRVFSGWDFLVFSPNTGKYGPEKTAHLETFHAN